MQKQREPDDTKKKTFSFYDEMIKGETKRFVPTKSRFLKTDHISINPLEARHILKFYNKKNRKPSPVVVTKYAKDMENDNWMFNGQPLTFSQEGDLMDGQHRLLALIKSNKTLNFCVHYGLKSESFVTIDNGKIRTNADVVGLEGYKDSAVLSSLVRSIIAYESSGKYDAKTCNLEGINQITKSEILNYLSESPEIVDYVGRYRKSMVVSSHVAAFCYWLLSSVNQEKAEEYLDQVFMGYELRPNTIEQYLNNKLQRNKVSPHNKMTKTAIIANVVLGWKRFTGVSKSNSLQISWDARNGIPKPY